MEFVKIPGFPSYTINREGVIKNLKDEIKTFHVQKVGGYIQCSLYDIVNKIMKTKSQHYLLAKTFIPNPDNLPHVAHINSIPTDNRIENLRWSTRADNEKDKGLTARNTSGQKFISWNKSKERWQIRIIYEGRCVTRYRKTMEEAIEDRDSMLALIVQHGV
jgi:hypothetical protein